MRLFQLIWGVFYRVVRFLEKKFPRKFPGAPRGKFLSGDEQLRMIERDAEGTFKLMGVQVVPFDDSCSVCTPLSHHTYPLESRPPIPLPDCPYGKQCRAIYAPVIDYGLYKVTQLLTRQPRLKVQEVRKLLREDADVESNAADGSERAS
jgi:hypothetical protein